MRWEPSMSGALLAVAVGIGLAVDLPGGTAGRSQAAEAPQASLAGSWTGHYRYNDTRLPPKAFTAAIAAAKGRSFTGRVTEPRYTRMGAAGQMSAVIEGSVGPGGKVHFIKRYQGIAGYGNPVRYEGTLGPKGRTIKGTWRIPAENLKGTFEMTRSGGGAI